VNLIFGAVIDENMGDAIRITVIATGFERNMPAVHQMTRQVERRLPTQQPVRQAVMAEPVRPEAPVRQPNSNSGGGGNPFRIDDLDIPTFLRKRK
jgi:cell division protein FtsZ